MFDRGMFKPGTFNKGMFRRGVFLQRARRPGVIHGVGTRLVSVSRLRPFAIAIALFASPALAQHGAGRSQPGSSSKPLICVRDCFEPNTDPTPEEDRRLQHLMAVQATPDQSASFNRLLQDVQTTRTQLQTFIQLLQKVPSDPAPSGLADSLEQAVEKALAGDQNFLASFSIAQKSGLKDTAKKVEAADSELDKQRTIFDRAVQSAQTQTEPFGASAASLEVALATLHIQQLALAREMSIVLPSDGRDLDFPAVKSTIDLAGITISIPASVAASRIAADIAAGGGHEQFSLRIIADFSDLQQNITGVVRSMLTSSPRCGERVEVQRAWLNPRAPAGLVAVRLHFERWICPGGSPMELASVDGTVEVKLTPALDPGAGVGLTAEFGRIDAEGLLRESLLSGSLGDTLRQQLAASLLPAVQKASGLKTTLPPALQSFATIRKVEFQDAGAGQLSLVLDGDLHLSEEQTKQFAAQAKQAASVQKVSPP
ncbi:MAG TPA: hypothetical protein VIW68_09545 [Candidatus Sulfotelmatobacter sp.]